MPTNADRIVVKCRDCGKTYSLKPELAGKSAKCSCGSRLKIPHLDKKEEPKQPSQVPRIKSEDVGSTKSMEPDLSDFFDDALGEEPPKGKPISEVSENSPDEFELEAPVERPQLNSTEPPQSKKATQKSRSSNSSSALKVLGVYGLIVMGYAILVATANVLFVIYLVLRPNVSLGQSVIVFSLLGVHLVAMLVIYRLGKGLINSERSSIDGLLVLYVLLGGIAIFSYFTWQEHESASLALGIFLGVLSFLFLPPMILGYMHRNDLYASDD